MRNMPTAAKRKKTEPAAEVRRFGMHPKLLFDVILRQAGTVESFEGLVRRMRQAQTEYFRRRGHAELIEAKRLEKLVDTWLRNKGRQDGQ